jgi:ATP-dependent exoDNAse (exonuclease V) beta subunit
VSDELCARDAATRVLALDVGRSFIVQAPAGSGKTELLIQRFLALLGGVAWPEEVVAITFTRKAAAEMRSRVLNALAAARGGAVAESTHERRTLDLARAALTADAQHHWGLTDNPARLRIQTIDSLCYSLVAQMPLLSRLGPTPAAREDVAELYREAAREALAQLENPAWSRQVAALLRHLDNDTQCAEALLARLLERRDQWLRHCENLDRDELSRALANLVRDRLRQVRDLFPAELIPDLLFCVRYVAAHVSENGKAAATVRATQQVVLPGMEPEDVPLWGEIASLLLTEEREFRRKANIRIGFPPPTEKGLTASERQTRTHAKQRVEALYERLATFPELIAPLVEVKQLPVPEYSDAQWLLIEALGALLPLALAQLELVFRRRNVVDFTQLLLAANQALGDPQAPTELALALDYRIRHLLVDEFQDTSLSQYQLVVRLTAGWQPGDGRTLFAVGDPMQSIYRFREAEVGLFLRAQREGIGSVWLEPLTLMRNFRSHPGLVNWVNRVFEKVLPARADPASGAVPFSPSVAARPTLSGDSVTIHGLEADGQAEAQRLVELITAARTEDSKQTIAVLVRSRYQLAHILPALKEAGLPFRAIDIEPLAHRPAIQDLHALTRALLHPTDRAAWLSMLRAPWCGLTLVDLERLVGEARDGVLWVRMTDPEVIARLTADGQVRTARLVEAIAPAREHRGRGALRRRVEGAWLRVGGPASVQERTDLDDVRVYLDLVEKLERGGDLDDFAALEHELAKLYALPDVEARETLQVMTIHKAKGLEFDTVFVPGLGFGVRQDDPELLRWIERPRGREGSDLLLAAIGASGGEDDAVYACVTRLLRQHQEHEDGRLLYVAATRARRRLHLLAQLKVERTEPDRVTVKAPPRGALLAKLWPALQTEFEPAAARAHALPAHANAQFTADPMSYPLRRIALDWKPPAFAPPVQWSSPPKEEELRDATVEFSWAGEAARHVGTVVHRLLQRIADEGVEVWEGRKVDAIDDVLSLALKQEGVPAEERQAALARVRRALSGVLADPRGRWLLSREHQDARSEHRLAGEHNGVFINVVLDRTFVDRHGVRWIVDYKTGVHEGGELEAFLDRERERYQGQLERYAALLARIESRPIRLGLYFPLLRGWREWEAARIDSRPRP